MTLSLIVLNDQGASEQTYHDNMDDLIAQINTWGDPGSLITRVLDDAQVIYDDNALVLAEAGTVQAALARIDDVAND